MSQAEDLLNSLANGGARDTEPVLGDFVIIGEDRFLQVPENLKKLGVSPDHDVNTVNFKAPRYSDGRDLSKMSIWVNYMREDGYMDSAHCENVAVDSEDSSLITFDWIITRNVTEVFGNLTMLVCAKHADAAGNEENHWNSELCRDFYVSEGMEVQETLIAPYPDIVEYLLLRMDRVEDKTTLPSMLAYIEQYLDQDPSVVIEKIEEVISTYPVQEYVESYLNEYVDIRTTENRILNDGYSGAYEMVRMDGVSNQVTTTGAQLFDHTADVFQTITQGGATLTNLGNGYFRISGNGVMPGTFSKYWYYSHEESVKLFKAGKLKVKRYGDSTMPKVYIHPQVNNSSLTTLSPGNIESFDLTQAIVDDPTFRVVLGIYGNQGETIVPGTFGIMLYQDGDGDMEAFSGGLPAPNPDYSQEIKSPGLSITIKTKNENLWPKLNRVTRDGIDMVPLADGGISFSGTASSTFSHVVPIDIPLGTYTFSLRNKEGIGSDVNDSPYFAIRYEGEWAASWNSSIENKFGTFVITKKVADILIVVPHHVVLDDWVIYPKIEAGTVVGEYVKPESTEAVITLNEPLRSVGDICDKIYKVDSRWGVERNVDIFIADGTSVRLFKNDGIDGNDNCMYVCNLPHKQAPGMSSKLIHRHNTADINRGTDPQYLGFTLTYNERHLFMNVGHYVPENTANLLNAWLEENPIDIQYATISPTWEELDAESQFALDNLKVYKGTTYVFIDGDIQPMVLSRYGTSNWGARAIDNTNRIEKLEELSETGELTHVVLSLHSGGTGGETAAEARENLEVYSKAEIDKVLGDINSVLESLIGGA